MGLSGSHRTGRYGTQRKPFYLTLRGSGSLEETASVSNPEESGKDGLKKQKQSCPYSVRKSGSEKKKQLEQTVRLRRRAEDRRNQSIFIQTGKVKGERDPTKSWIRLKGSLIWKHTRSKRKSMFSSLTILM